MVVLDKCVCSSFRELAQKAVHLYVGLLFACWVYTLLGLYVVELFTSSYVLCVSYNCSHFQIKAQVFKKTR